jgi:hypothetical protein
MTRWFGVGRSTSRDSYAAGAEAARAALTGPDAKLLLVFAAISHDLAALQSGVQDVAGPVPVIGCTTHGEIGPGGPRDGSVSVAALGGAGFSVGTGTAEQVSGHQRQAGAKVAEEANAVGDRPHQVLLLLTDGLTRDQEEILRGCYSILGAQVPLSGGAAADGWRMTGTFLMADGKVLHDAVVAAMIGSDAPLSVSVRHGFHLVGPAMFVTSGANGRVLTLDDRPALDVYLERLGAPPEAYTDAPALMEFALAHPLGLQRRSGIDAFNISTEIDLEGRSIGGGCELDPGGVAWAMAGDEESILAAVDDACRDALAGLHGRTPIGLLTFSCAALRAILGEAGIHREVGRLESGLAGAPFAGFYTYGEIARVRGISGFHNQTLVVLAVA